MSNIEWRVIIIAAAIGTMIGDSKNAFTILSFSLAVLVVQLMLQILLRKIRE